MTKDNETLEAWFERTHMLDIEPDDDQDEMDEEFREYRHDAAIEAERRQDAQVSRAAADYLAGGD